MIFQRVKAKGF